MSGEPRVARCAACKKKKVPEHEWPQDRRWPILCADCLRSYTAPGQPGSQVNPAQGQK